MDLFIPCVLGADNIFNPAGLQHLRQELQRVLHILLRNAMMDHRPDTAKLKFAEVDSPVIGRGYEAFAIKSRMVRWSATVFVCAPPRSALMTRVSPLFLPPTGGRSNGLPPAGPPFARAQ